jgi:cysteine desulfurase / selenocysteine lyase
MIDVAQARALTPGAAHQAYFYSCGAGLMPAPVLDAVHGHLDREALIGGYAAEDEAAPAVEATYDAIARLINCHPDEVAVVENATVAWCQAFYGLAQDMKPGDRVLTVVAEYASNFIALLQTVQRRGIVIDVIPNDGEGQADLEALEGLIDDDVKLIAVTHVPTSGGLVSPAAEIGAIARRHGIPYLLDACQSAGQLPLDVEALGCDFLPATGNKFPRRPHGTGFLYASRAIMERCEPPVLDLHSARWTAPDAYEMRPDARRYENWENYVAGKIGLGVAVEHALSWGLDAIAARNAELSGDLRERLAAIPEVTLRDAGRHQCAIVTFSHERIAPEVMAATLSVQGFAIGTSGASSTLIDFQARDLPPLCRAAVHYHNTEDEVARLAEAIAAL